MMRSFIAGNTGGVKMALIRKQDKGSKKVCFSIPLSTWQEYQEVKKKVKEKGYVVDFSQELREYFKRLLKRAQDELQELH